MKEKGQKFQITSIKIITTYTTHIKKYLISIKWTAKVKQTTLQNTQITKGTKEQRKILNSHIPVKN